MVCYAGKDLVILNSEHKDACFIDVCEFGGQMCMSSIFEYACHTFKYIQNIYNSLDKYLYRFIIIGF